VAKTGDGLGADHLREEIFRNLVPVQHRPLRALFVIEHELDGDPRVARPTRVRRVFAIADQITGIGTHAAALR